MQVSKSQRTHYFLTESLLLLAIMLFYAFSLPTPLYAFLAEIPPPFLDYRMDSSSNLLLIFLLYIPYHRDDKLLSYTLLSQFLQKEIQKIWIDYIHKSHLL